MMKTIALLLVLLALSQAQNMLKGRANEQQKQNSQCPTNCNCQTIKDHGNPHISYGMANCTAMPAALDHSIRHLKVNAVISTLTKEMIAALGKDLRLLDLSGCQITRIEKGTFSSSQQLETLVLSHNELTDIDEGEIACHALEKLYLDGNKIKKIDNDAFHELQSLEYLYLQQNKLQKFSAKIPNVIVLDISYNNIKNLDLDIGMTQLESLDLCSNDLEQFPFKTSTKSNNLQNLCLSDKAAFIPEGILAMFPSLKNLTLMASDNHKIMDKKIQTQLKKLNELSILYIVSYHLHNLEFLPHNLIVLSLRNVVVENTTGFQHLTNLNKLILDQSPQLVPLLLNNATLMSKLTKLHMISLRKTYIVSFGSRNIPKSVKEINIAENPLHCDCKLAWIVAKERFLMDTDHTICKTPQNVYQQRLKDVINPSACSNSDDGILEQSDKDEWHEELADHTLLYIILGTVLLILLLIGIILAIVLTVMRRRRRKCHISPEGGNVGSERTQQQQMKQSSSSDMLIKK
ncbi:hypothetical protein C0J52_14216 [Blattella germanica]|nr:hypothetical protein C0J52_14216 [Blattella germanica]